MDDSGGRSAHAARRGGGAWPCPDRPARRDQADAHRGAAPPGAPAVPRGLSNVMALFMVPGRGPILVIDGSHTGVLELGEQGSVFSPCDLVMSAAGAIPIPGGLRVVTQEAAVFEVSAGS